MPGLTHCHCIEDEKRFRCELCGLIYREPVQNIKTGKCFCKSCVSNEDTADYRQDNAVWKEMKCWTVHCEVCGWQGRLEKFESHLCPLKTDVFQENIYLKGRLAVEEQKKFNLLQQMAKLEEKLLVLEVSQRTHAILLW
ncbi:hypothetical protein GBAR_LOCUS30293 [Geodia barretti]|uniref:Uncharacterized protein n=1 Tax=Geodia barretti TaxID=519541 RepID=A0AA35XFG1_GEOBA|nr:hypothetical protein GBAR_LOCUS30293 [Geodia barretti]